MLLCSSVICLVSLVFAGPATKHAAACQGDCGACLALRLHHTCQHGCSDLQIVASCRYGWYLQRIKQLVDEVRLETGCDQVGRGGTGGLA